MDQEKLMKEFVRTCRLIAKCDIEMAANIINEVLMFHPIVCWNSETKSLDGVESVRINEGSIQLNLEESHRW